MKMSAATRYNVVLLFIALSPSSAFQFLGRGSKTQSGDEEYRPSSLEYRRRFLFDVIQTSFFGCLLAAEIPPAFASNLPEPTGADTSKVGSVDSLIGVVALRSSLAKIEINLTNHDKSHIPLDTSIPKDEIAFKRIFDSYSDPVSYKQKFLDQNAFLVYYSKGFDGPGRDNIESNENERQTQQFGLRNEAWIAWENLLTELQFLEESDNDCSEYISSALRAVDSYLSLAPKGDLTAAKGRLEVTW